jgi:hypothetical protein
MLSSLSKTKIPPAIIFPSNSAKISLELSIVFKKVL